MKRKAKIQYGRRGFSEQEKPRRHYFRIQKKQRGVGKADNRRGAPSAICRNSYPIYGKGGIGETRRGEGKLTPTACGFVRNRRKMREKGKNPVNIGGEFCKLKTGSFVKSSRNIPGKECVFQPKIRARKRRGFSEQSSVKKLCINQNAIAKGAEPKAKISGLFFRTAELCLRASFGRYAFCPGRVA